jgi:D-3-phosphoglycerate dehydrogenase
MDLETLLAESDFISLHTPLTAETRGMIGHDQFARMKRTCYFINTSRGGCVEQPGLVRALREGLIAGAGIDVTADEPLSPDNPLLAMPNVILTGHIAWYSVTSDIELYRKPVTQVIEVLKGKWPVYAVNPEARSRWVDRWGNKG